jgi:hypothetical protein
MVASLYKYSGGRVESRRLKVKVEAAPGGDEGAKDFGDGVKTGSFGLIG